MLNVFLSTLLFTVFQSNTVPENLQKDANILSINWYSNSVTSVFQSNDNEYSLAGYLSFSPTVIINCVNSTIIPYGIIGGFFSSECDVSFNTVQSEDYYSISNDKLTFKLYSNYPNPFKGMTHIKYDIPYLSDITLVIYDICGREIKQLINAKQDVGHYTVSWNGKDNKDEQCSAGVYFVSMKTDNYNNIKKIIITK